MTIIQPVILSGGTGSRLWPASRTTFPKQFLRLTGDRTMLQETALRVAGKGNLASRMLAVCNEAHRFLVAEQFREIGIPAMLLLEPEGRNTAPAVALAALHVLHAHDGLQEKPLLLVMPADHDIKDGSAFITAIETAEESAIEGNLISFGVVPTHAHTGYGYIESDAKSLAACRVLSFVEKPDKQTAVNLLETNRYFWNSGIFLFRADVFIDELEKYEPAIVESCKGSFHTATRDSEFVRPSPDEFLKNPSKSIDYALMERTNRALMVPLVAGWSDIGSWAALHDACNKDDSGNTLIGNVTTRNCRNSYVRANSRVVATVGLDNLIVVEEKDAVLVTSKEGAEEVKLLVEQLQRESGDVVRQHRQVQRPWGSYDSVDYGDNFQVKRLIVNPGAVLSLQKHARRAEHWVVVKGTAQITRNDEEFELTVNESTHIPVGTIHRIANVGPEPVHIIEVQCGDYLGEDDIERLEDIYGREGTNL